MLIKRGSASRIAPDAMKVLNSMDAEQLEAIHRLIPVIVDTTLHYVPWTLEEWSSIRIAVETENGAVEDIRTLTQGELQGYLYDWIARFSKERHELVV